MQILGWIGKPVLLLLNQTGPPRGSAADAEDARRWREHLAAYPWVRCTLGLDAFARCWVQEDALLGAVCEVLSERLAAACARLRAAWRTLPSAHAPPEFTAAGIEFVLFCESPTRSPLIKDLPTDTLLDRLNRGETPAWLERIESDRASGNVLYRVVP